MKKFCIDPREKQQWKGIDPREKQQWKGIDPCEKQQWKSINLREKVTTLEKVAINNCKRQHAQ